MSALFILFSMLLMAQLLYPMVSILAARLFGKEKEMPLSPAVQSDFACIITAYKNAEIALPLVKSLLQQTYPHLQVYLVADECPALDWPFSDERATLLRPDSPLRLKVKSIKYAVAHFSRQHTHIAIFDADNLAHPQFLEQTNRYVNAGHRCIQGQRRAKNLDTTYAALDSLGEHYKNYIERYVPYLLGGSAVISGSGMATETALYQQYLASPEIEKGQHLWKKMLQEDKILQNFILRSNGRIAFARNAIVYDEKVLSGAAVETQRSRWLFSYFQNVPNSSGLLLRGLLGLRFNQLYFGFATLALPMFIQLALAMFLAVLGCWIAPAWSLALVLSVGVFGAGVLLALYLDGAPAPVWAALWQVPKFVFRQFLSLFKMRNPNKFFGHTEHRG
jgi:cellulose synthase/poly-beta-1,6-N-acetylglucosamine synthase-like glycosyltransferase